MATSCWTVRRAIWPAIHGCAKPIWERSHMPESGCQVGIDIGGTFTDLVALLPATGEVRSIKVPTQRNDPVASILAALAAAGLTSEEVDDLIHGTTLVTNAIV